MKEKYQKLIKNLQFYQDSLELLEQLYQGKYLVIWEEQVTGIYLSYEEALEKANQAYEPGTFLLKHCQMKSQVQKPYAVKNGIIQAVTQVQA